MEMMEVPGSPRDASVRQLPIASTNLMCYLTSHELQQPTAGLVKNPGLGEVAKLVASWMVQFLLLEAAVFRNFWSRVGSFSPLR